MMEVTEQTKFECGMIYSGYHQGTGLLIRYAAHQDYESVMDINRSVYFGGDYLPVMYHEFLGDTKMLAFVAESQNKIIAYVALMKADSNRLLISVGARIQAGYSKKGLFELFKQICISTVSKRYPTVRHVWDVSLYTEQIAKWIKKKNGTLIAKWNHIACVGTMDQLRRKYKSSRRPAVDVQPLSLTATKSLLSHPTTLNKLFPDNFLLLANKWLPVRTSPQSLSSAAQMCDFFATFDNDLGCVALSTCYVFPCQGGMSFMMSYMGREDQEMLKGHILNYVEYCLRVSDRETEKIIFKVAFPWSISREDIAAYISQDFSKEFVDSEYGALYQLNQ